MSKTTHYPSYDVMSHAEHWDDHTQHIVTSRLIREKSYSFLTTVEAEILRAWCSKLVGDMRGEIIQYVLCHIDQTLSDGRGEGQRKPDVAPAPELIRKGLKAIDATCQSLHAKHFFELEDYMQQGLMKDISEGSAEPASIWASVPQQDLFKKLLNYTLEAYYSHPTVWSEIGYAGPAYPRGYIRARAGQWDAWEARLENES
ncbi:gluconate 2-dehydrogenase subunit 3 family protein [Paenibacillus hamazuiensis]|uniref:gluconate 2-dehydrogenase subunit 3 family protein n=1 Tax=Paenibacillus hamazuiensis TaxID=2936508 RepID=UPI00200D99FB|nr:gluconate 2-dehydrogenase subunit 3 family protein [Paenibacillus hamazuiensis]